MGRRKGEGRKVVGVKDYSQQGQWSAVGAVSMFEQGT